MTFLHLQIQTSLLLVLRREDKGITTLMTPSMIININCYFKSKLWQIGSRSAHTVSCYAVGKSLVLCGVERITCGSGCDIEGNKICIDNMRIYMCFNLISVDKIMRPYFFYVFQADGLSCGQELRLRCRSRA